MEQISREALVASVRAAIRSVTRAPIKVEWPSDNRFYIEVRIPRFSEQLELGFIAQMLTTGLGSSERLPIIIRNNVVSFRLPLELADGTIACAVYNAEPLPDMQVVQLTPDDIFSEESEYAASFLLSMLVLDALLTAQGRTRTVAQGIEAVSELFPVPNQTSSNAVDESRG